MKGSVAQEGGPTSNPTRKGTERKGTQRDGAARTEKGLLALGASGAEKENTVQGQDRRKEC